MVRRFVLNIVLLCFSVYLHAGNFNFKPITTDNGLSNFVVTAFYKDSTGFLWIGTDVSLDRFDGLNFKHFSFDSPDIYKKRVRCIVETLRNDIYVGNGLGLWKINFQTLKPERLFPREINVGVSALEWDSDSQKLYIGTDKGLFVLADNKLTFHHIDKNVFSGANVITDFVVNKDNSLWITTRQGLCLYDLTNKSGKMLEFDEVKGQQSFFAKITRIKNTLYLGTSKTGLVTFDINTQKFSKFLDVGSDIITDISSDNEDKLYVATDGNGVHFISHSQQRVIDTFRYNPNNKTGIRSNSVYSLLVDRDGIIWIGFYQAGLDYKLYQNSYFNIFEFLPKFSSKDLHVRTFLINGDDKLIGTRDGLFLINEKKNEVLFYDKKHLRSNLILSLCYFSGKYYIGTYGGGVSVLDEQTRNISTISSDFSLVKGHVFHIERGPEGNIWFATSGGVYSYDSHSESLISFTSVNSQILPGNVYYLFFDSSKKGWFATENGLCIYDPKNKIIRANVFPDGFFNKEIIKVIYEDNDRNLYFCPDKGNILRSDINMRDYSTFNLTARFEGRVFLSILKDSDNYFWIGTDNGLIRIREDEDSYYSFGFRDGVTDPVFSTDAIFKDDNDILWLGNAKGLLFAGRSKLAKIMHSPIKVTLTEFNVNGESWDNERTLDLDNVETFKLNYNQNNIKVRFVSMQYTDPATIVFEYKLEGLDSEWNVLPKGQSEITYNNLNAGNYILKIRTEGNELSEKSVQITVRSFFTYKFWLFFMIIAISIYFSASKIINLFTRMKNRIASLTSMVQKVDLQNYTSSEEKYKFSKITEEECENLSKMIHDYFEKEKPYTRTDLKLVDLAQALNCSSHTLSFIFNQYLTKNYYDFINEYRIKEFKRLVSGTESSKYTLSALAEQCGFSSRASFFRSFKKLTGITPNEYIRSIGKNLHVIEGEEES